MTSGSLLEDELVIQIEQELMMQTLYVLQGRDNGLEILVLKCYGSLAMVYVCGSPIVDAQTHLPTAIDWIVYHDPVYKGIIVRLVKMIKFIYHNVDDRIYLKDSLFHIDSLRLILPPFSGFSYHSKLKSNAYLFTSFSSELLMMITGSVSE